METRQGGVRRIGRFDIERELGRGAQGTVYLARDPRLGRRVALKTLHLQGDHEPAAVERLLREARTAGRLTHPNIVPVYEVGAADGQPYVVFEYAAGQTLRSLLAQAGALAPETAIVMMSQILAGMAHAHAAGVVHGDLSPANILIGDGGVPRVIDFGIAAMLRSQHDPAAPLCGTVRYMAPERFQGRPGDCRSDVFALGLLFFEMLTGTAEFSADNDYGLIYQVLHEAAVPPSQRASGIDPALDAIVLHALQKDPARRYADAGAMKQALDCIRVRASVAGQSLRQDTVHGTVDFLLRRMRHKSDFPVLSQRLGELNRLTADDSLATIRKLGNFVLQDFALTSKLLRLANQAATGRSGVSNITVAIGLLGMAQVRVAATGLMLAAPLERGPRAPELTEAIRGAFVAGVIGWNLGRLLRVDNAEELFICSMFSRLGEILTIYYFPEEFAEIRRQARSGSEDETAVVRSVLGISYGELGVEIARRWNFPEIILQAQAPLPAGVVPQARHRGDRLAHCAGFARELCQLAVRTPAARIAPLLDQLLARYAVAVPCSCEQLQVLLLQSIAIAQQYCQAAGVPGGGGPLIEALAAWCRQPLPEAAAPPAARRRHP